MLSVQRMPETDPNDPGPNGPGPVGPDPEGVAKLVAACLSGCPTAWTELVQRHTPLVRTITRSHGLRPADADDVTQTTWMLVFQHLPKLRKPERLATWITTTARRECIKQVNRMGRDPSTEPAGDGTALEHPDEAATRPEERVLARERNDEVLLAFCDLDSRCQVLLSLLLATDPPLSYTQIAAILRVPRGSLGPTRSRCLERLAQQLEHIQQRRQQQPPVPARSESLLYQAQAMTAATGQLPEEQTRRAVAV